MSSSFALPVQVLREHVSALEAAISVCLATPDSKPVHKLRTETRRTEALLLLLALVPGLPEHRKQAAALLRSLSRLRRAAGKVRDLDVHRKMLDEFAEVESSLAHAPVSADGSEPRSRKRAARGTAAAPRPGKKTDTAAQDTTAALLSDAASELRRRMGRERDKAALALKDLLKQRQKKTVRAAEKLLHVLDPARGLVLPVADLLRDAEAILLRDGILKSDAIADLDEDHLHSVRKAAKAARYLAESVPDDPALAKAARDFESLQEAGGKWHDALELSRAARRYFGKNHELTATYRAQRDTHLKAYRAALTARATETGSAARKPAPAKRPTTRRRSST